jgi:phosphate starvation-inducible protein PhoH
MMKIRRVRLLHSKYLQVNGRTIVFQEPALKAGLSLLPGNVSEVEMRLRKLK